MNNYSAQGSITVKRLRSGDSLFITIENNGKPLYQGIDSNSGTISPDWSVAENQPVLTPKVTSTRGMAVVLTLHQWSYNGVELIFQETGAEGPKTDTTGKFQLNTDGSLRIIGNLASITNIANDILTYTCVATVAGVEYNLTKSVDVIIQPIGASSYYGTIMATTEQLTAEELTSTVTTQLYLSAVSVSEYHVKWYKDDTLWPEKNGQKTITITRDDVNGTQLFIAEFYKTAEDATPVFRAGLRIIDTQDDFMVVCVITSANKQVDVGEPVTVSAKVINARTNSVVAPEAANWRMDIMDRNTWEVLKTAAANTIEVTTAETDRNGEENDVEVIAEVEWN